MTAGRERLTLTLIASFASPNKSSMESIMLWSWTSALWMSCMEASTPELSMLKEEEEEEELCAAQRQAGRQIVWPVVKWLTSAYQWYGSGKQADQHQWNKRVPSDAGVPTSQSQNRWLRLTVRNGQRWCVVRGFADAL